MQSLSTSCNTSVGGHTKCPYCDSKAIKYGKTKQDKPRCRCQNETCRKTFLLFYSNNACVPHINHDIVKLLKEGCGIRSIGRLLSISNTTVIRRILIIANRICKPPVSLNKSYEVDEMCTYYKNKQKPLWIAYAIEKMTGRVADFAIGNRTRVTFNKVIGTLLLSGAMCIYTDRLPLYSQLIPDAVHYTSRYGTNRIERMNLTLRTHLKRLNRRTICFSKRMVMLIACLKIYFWYP